MDRKKGKLTTNYNFGFYRLGEFEVYTTDCNCGNNSTVGVVDEVHKENNFELHVYPNPATEFITIKTNVTEKTNLQIYDLHGKLWLNKVITASATTISTSQLLVGTYIAVVEHSKKQMIKKFVKIK